MKKNVLWNFDRLSKALSSEVVRIDKTFDFGIENVVFDSRKITNNSLFVAKKGENTDGHNFINDVLKNTNACVLADAKYLDKYSNEPRVIVVNDTVYAMEMMARYARDTVKGTVFGITGSLGKTTTKEIFYSCLAEIGKSFRNIMSFNNHMGVLTTLCNLPQDTDYAIIEMGMSEKGEMEKLSSIVRPDITVITNIAKAHMEFFESEEGIAYAKAEIFKYQKNDGFTVLNRDTKYYNLLVNEAKNNGIDEIHSFSADDNDADVMLKKYYLDKQSGNYGADYVVDGKFYSFLFNSSDYNVAVNFMTVLACCKSLAINPKSFRTAMENFGTPRGRNNVEEANYDGKHITLINGTYNAVNPVAFTSGLELLKRLDGKNSYPRRIAIFGDIREAGENSEAFMLSLEKPILDAKIDVFIGIGEHIKSLCDNLKSKIQVKYFKESAEVILILKELLKNNDIVFIKSSKGIKTWKILDEITGYPTEIFE